MSDITPKADLEAVLEAQRAQGRYFDSGQFGLDSLKALAKLSQYQLNENGLWLVKLVQAAVVTGAPRFEVEFGRRRVKVRFEPSQQWQADELLHRMVSGQLPSDRGLLHLVTGLRSCASPLTQTLTWSCGKAKVVLEGEKMRVESQSETNVFELTTTRPPRQVSLGRALTTNLAHVVWQTADEYEALCQRCWVSPVPIVVDGRPISCGYGAVVRGSVVSRLQARISKQSSQVQACLGLRELASTASRPELASLESEPTKNEISLTSPLYFHETFLRWPTPSRHGAVAIHAAPYVASSVELVLDGAVVESHPLELFQARPSKLLGMQASTRTMLRPRLIFALRPDEVDVSGFASRGLEIDSLIRQAVPEMVELLHAIAYHRKSLTYLGSPRPPSKLLLPLLLPLRLTHAPIFRRQMISGIEELLLAIKDAVE